MTVFLWHLALSVAVAAGAYAALQGAPASLPVSPLLASIAFGDAAGALAWLCRWAVLRAARARAQRQIRRSWWTPEQMAR